MIMLTSTLGVTTPTYDLPPREDDTMEVTLLTSLTPENDETIVSFYQDQDDLSIVQYNPDGPPDVVYLSRDMAIELLGILHTYVNATAE